MSIWCVTVVVVIRCRCRWRCYSLSLSFSSSISSLPYIPVFSCRRQSGLRQTNFRVWPSWWIIPKSQTWRHRLTSASRYCRRRRHCNRRRCYCRCRYCRCRHCSRCFRRRYCYCRRCRHRRCCYYCHCFRLRRCCIVLVVVFVILVVLNGFIDTRVHVVKSFLFVRSCYWLSVTFFDGHRISM